MRIWLIQRAEPTPNDNKGKQRLMRTGILCNKLNELGHNVIWWTSTFDHYNRRHRFNVDTRILIREGFYIQYLKGLGYKKNISIPRIIDNNLVARKFKKLAFLEKDKPDLILSSVPTSELSLEATKFAKKNNIPIILDIRDLWPDVFLDVLPKFCTKIYPLFSKYMERKIKKSCRDATYITGITSKFVDWGINHSGRERTELDREFRLGYYPPDVYDNELKKGYAFWNDLGIKVSKKQLLVCFIGTIGNVFDFEPIIESAKILNDSNPRIKFVICGNGEKLDYLKNKSLKLNNILYPGWIYNYQILSLLNIADIGIAPYMPINSFLETISNKAAEYLYGRLPIALSVNKGPLYQLLKDQKAGIFYSCSGEKLAEELIRLSNDDSLLNQLKDNAFRTFEEFLDGKVIYKNFINYLENIAEKNLNINKSFY